MLRTPYLPQCEARAAFLPGMRARLVYRVSVSRSMFTLVRPLHVYTSRFSAGVPAPLVARSAGLLPRSHLVTPSGYPKSLLAGAYEYSRGEIARAGRCGRTCNSKSARCRCAEIYKSLAPDHHHHYQPQRLRAPVSAALCDPLFAFHPARLLSRV